MERPVPEETRFSKIHRKAERVLSYDFRKKNWTAVHSRPKLSKAKKQATDQIKVIILTYMRSGSSLTGDLIQQHPDVFYIFEPLWSIANVSKEGNERLLRFRNGTTHYISDEADLWNLKLRWMEAVLSCNFAQLDIKTQTQWFFPYIKATVPYRLCLDQSENNQTKQEKCIEELSSRCRSVKIKAIKVIQADMEHARQMIQRDPTIRVIHLLRDPRGCLRSQSQTRQFKWYRLREILNAADNLCGRIERDINSSKSITSELPGRILTVRYEDIAKSPIEAARQLYMFIGLQLTSSIETYIWNITYAGGPDGCNICTNRGNANATANGWRKLVTPELSARIVKRCGNVFSTLGYKSFKTKATMKNLNISSYEDTFDPELMTLRSLQTQPAPRFLHLSA